MALNELSSLMIYIHPPLAIIGYSLIFFTAFLTFSKLENSKIQKRISLGAWTFTFLGLLTGMLWAQLAWGSYWSWDIKETMTLLLFLSVSGNLVAGYEKRRRIAKWLSILSCILVIITTSTSFIPFGLHIFT